MDLPQLPTDIMIKIFFTLVAWKVKLQLETMLTEPKPLPPMDVPPLPTDILMKILHIKGQNDKQIAHDKHKQKFQSTIACLADARMGWTNDTRANSVGERVPIREWVPMIW
jgi:hypothetical protein